MKKRILTLCMGLLLLTACTPQTGGNEVAEGEKEAPKEKVFVLGSEQFTTTLDPASEYWGWYTIRYGIGETLFRLNEDLELEPWLAESYENLDPTSWKITLKDNVVFSDGTPVTGQVVVDNLKRVGDMNDRALSLKEAKYTVEGNTITIQTKEPKAAFINDLVDPYASIIKIDSIVDGKADKIIGTGPYQVESFTAEKEIALTPNKNYWNGQPKLDRVQVKKIIDKETGSMALKNGEIDAFIELNPESYASFQDDENFMADSKSTSRAFAMYYNLEKLPDANLRKAIHLALDKESISKNLLKGMMSPTNGMFPDFMAYGNKNIKSEGYDLEGAKKLLQESGYKDTDGDGYLEKDGKTLDLDIHFYKRLALESLATELQATLDKIGIKSHLSSHDSSDYLKNGQYDIGFYSVVTSPTGDPEAYLTRISKEDGEENYNGFKDEKINGLIHELSKTVEVEKRAQLAIEIQQGILDQYAHEYFGFNNLNLVSKKEVKGMIAHPSDYYQVTADIDKE